jgi:hypothetical protein
VRRLVRDTCYVALGPADRIAQASNPAFDAATFEIWGALLNGGAVVGVPREVLLAPAALERLIADEGITTLFVTTALFHQYARERPGALAGLGCVLFGGEACNPRLVRAVLEAGPPRRLLPAAWVELAALPITANGKLDRAALPAPEDANGAAGAGGAPRSFLEQVAMEIWAEVLGVARIGREAGFFELGGHSLAAMQAAARAQDRLGLEVSARSLFDATTLAGWAEHLAAQQLAQTDPEILAAVLAELEASRGSATHQPEGNRPWTTSSDG